MTPTLMGRIQTRLFLLATVGVVWTLLISPILPADGAPLSEVYELTFTALFIVAFLGVVLWEPLYHFAQQYRWEKDWPTGIGLVAGIAEGVVCYAVLQADRTVPGAAFTIHFATTWFVVWLAANGPLRILLVRWRYRGGRII